MMEVDSPAKTTIPTLSLVSCPMVLMMMFLASSSRLGSTSCAFIELETSSRKITLFIFCLDFISSEPPNKSTMERIRNNVPNK